MNALIAVAAVVVILIVILFAVSIKIVNEYERGVIFRLGRSLGAKGPGVFFIIPIIDRMMKTNLQIVATPVTPQAVITKDNVTCTVDAVAYFQVVDPAASVIRVKDWYQASQLVAQTTLRSIVGRHELDQLLTERERRSKIIAADGELQASEKLAQAADVISGSPGALQLRQLQTMVEISAENNSTIIFPIPIEILERIQRTVEYGVSAR